ncbi:MAG: hypothetical protein RIR91_1040 [Verrucomicrobiota bacterium]|jgi:hypothetical protein
MPHFKAVCALLLAMVSLPSYSVAQTAPAAGAGGATAAAGKSAVFVRNVTFQQTKLGGQVNPWNRMQVEIQANSVAEAKAPAAGDAKAANKKWVDKVKVTVTQIYKTTSAKPEDWNYYRSSVTVLTIEVNQPRSVLFYLPGDIVKRDNLKKEPDYYYVQLEVGGNEEPLFAPTGVVLPDQKQALHKDLQSKAKFDPAKDAADRGVVSTPGILRPQYLVLYSDTPVVPPSPEFIREDVPTR